MMDEKDSINLEDKTKNYNTVPVSEEDNSTEFYDPHLHRQVEHPTTNIETLVHILKGSLGTGILAMPLAFHHAGYLLGFIGTIVIGVICTYCLHILVGSQYILCKKHRVPILSYPISMKMALESGPPSLRCFAPFAIVIVDGFLIVYQLGICCVYIVFVAKNVQQVVDVHCGPMDIKIYMCCLLVPLLLIYSIRNLKLLAPFSTFANILTFVGIGLLMTYIFDKPKSFDELHAFGQVEDYALFFGTVLFALEAVGVIIALENNMKTPKSFGGYLGVLNIGMAFITVLYAIMGILGYLKYGKDAASSLTLNLDDKDILAQSIKIIFAVAIFISYALQGFVPVEIIWNNYLKKSIGNTTPNRALMYEYGVRFLVVIVTFLLAIAIPLLDLFISLCGALCLSVLGLAFPAIMEICVLWPNKLNRLTIIKDILLILFGLLGLVIGTFISVRKIVEELSK